MRTRLVSPIILALLFLGLVLCGTPTIAEETTSASGLKIETGFAEVNGTRPCSTSSLRQQVDNDE